MLFAISARPSNKYRKYTSCMLRAWLNSAHARTQGCLQKGRVVSLPYKALRLAHVVDLTAKSQFAESWSQNWRSRCFKIAVPIMAQKGKLWFWWQFWNNYIWSNFSDFTTSTQKVHKEEKFPYFRKIQAGEVLKFCKIFMNTKHFKRRSHFSKNLTKRAATQVRSSVICCCKLSQSSGVLIDFQSLFGQSLCTSCHMLSIMRTNSPMEKPISCMLASAHWNATRHRNRMCHYQQVATWQSAGAIQLRLGSLHCHIWKTNFVRWGT